MNANTGNYGIVGAALAMLLFIAFTVGCAGQVSRADAEPQAEDVPSLEVYNNHPEDVRVYLLVGGTQIFLGTVDSFTSRTLEIPRSASTTTSSILIQTFASRATFRTHEVDFVTYPSLDLRVATNIKMTTISPRR